MNRSIFSICLLVLSLLSAFSNPISWNKVYQDYFDTYKDMAISQMRQYGIPASITLAQGVLESGAGRSELARMSNNHFGIKCNGWTGRKVYHDDDAQGECFRAYDNAFDSYVDHSLFLKNSQRYSRLFQLKKTDYKGWAYGLKSCGYATSPTYATRLIEIIELYGLDKYDRETPSTEAGRVLSTVPTYILEPRCPDCHLLLLACEQKRYSDLIFCHSLKKRYNFNKVICS